MLLQKQLRMRLQYSRALFGRSRVVIVGCTESGHTCVGAWRGGWNPSEGSALCLSVFGLVLGLSGGTSVCSSDKDYRTPV
jgi:hypothetical protein